MRTATGCGTSVPFGAEVMLNVEDAWAGSLPDHGLIEAVVVYGPHNAGVFNGARYHRRSGS